MEIHKYISEITHKYHSQIEEFTREEFERIIMELIQSGDLVRLSTPEKLHTIHSEYTEMTLSSYQGLTYIPFRIAQELQARINELEGRGDEEE